jgi:hypothetical protein
MPRQGKRSGRLVQKKLPENAKTFRVIGVDVLSKDAWTLKSFFALSEAIDYIDTLAKSGVDYYVHSNNNRVEYTRKGSANG